jgi:hypothetical protein
MFVLDLIEGNIIPTSTTKLIKEIKYNIIKYASGSIQYCISHSISMCSQESYKL